MGDVQVLGLMGVAQDITERKGRRPDPVVTDAVESTREFICITDLENRSPSSTRRLSRYVTASRRSWAGNRTCCTPQNQAGLGEHILEQTRRADGRENS